MSAAGSPGTSRRIANTRTDTARRTRARAATRRATKGSTMGALYPRPNRDVNQPGRAAEEASGDLAAVLSRVTFGSHRTFRFDEAWSGRASSSAPERRPREAREGRPCLQEVTASRERARDGGLSDPHHARGVLGDPGGVRGRGGHLPDPRAPGAAARCGERGALLDQAVDEARHLHGALRRCAGPAIG